MACRRCGDTRGVLTVTRRSRVVAGAPGSETKIAGVVGRWRSVVGEDFK
jgi:hypothetical protein